MKLIKAIQILLVVLVVLMLVVLAGVLIVNAIEQDQLMAHMPIVVLTQRGQPDWYCLRIDEERRIAYECLPTGKPGAGVYPEYHLSASDSWVRR